MKIEQKQLRDILIKMAVVIIFASLYAAGGSADFGGMKWLRRFLAPGVMVGGMFWFSRDWRALVQLPFMFGALCLPYGADTLWGKIFLRASFGAANGVASSGNNLLKKRWLLAGFQIVFVTATSVCFGVWNPWDNAMQEQFVIGLAIAAIPVLSS